MKNEKYINKKKKKKIRELVQCDVRYDPPCIERIE